MKEDDRVRARRRLDERLSALKPEGSFLPPPRGWIRAIRDALGMSGVQLAQRLGIRPQTLDTIEKSEAAGSIQLSTLRRTAEAMNCTLVYALVPNTSLDDAVNQRARRIAVRELSRVAHTMRLEAQEVDAAAEEQIEDYIRKNIKDRDVWNEP